MAMTTADMPPIEPGSSSEATLDISAHGARGAGLKVVLPLGFDAIIGRADAATVHINDQGVSWQHARLVHDERGVMLADLHSTNGTRINGNRITGPSLLHDGDVVSFGAVNATFRSASWAQRQPEAPSAAGRLTPEMPIGERPAEPRAAKISLPAGIPAASGARPSPALSARSRRFRPGLVYTAFAKAAAIAVLVAVGVHLQATGNSSTQYTAALASTDLAPGASGSATMIETATGWRIELKVTGLPRRDHGRYYEAWLENAAGKLVPVGTFNEGTSVTLWAGVPPTKFPTLTVTEQKVGSNQASSGKRVLSGLATESPVCRWWATTEPSRSCGLKLVLEERDDDNRAASIQGKRSCAHDDRRRALYCLGSTGRPLGV
jgi:pSer/pThr/pTyr-binding forkhead associated (FHA) protein